MHFVLVSFIVIFDFPGPCCPLDSSGWMSRDGDWGGTTGGITGQEVRESGEFSTRPEGGAIGPLPRLSEIDSGRLHAALAASALSQSFINHRN